MRSRLAVALERAALRRRGVCRPSARSAQRARSAPPRTAAAAPRSAGTGRRAFRRSRRFYEPSAEDRGETARAGARRCEGRSRMLHRMRTVASGRGFLLLSCGLGAPLSRPAPALLARASPALRGAVPPVLSRARTIACSAAGEPPAPRELTISTNPSLDQILEQILTYKKLIYKTLSPYHRTVQSQ